MAQDLHCLKRRELLHAANAAPAKLTEVGRDFVVSGHLSDAVDFMVKAGDNEGLERLIEVTLDEGDLFLYKRIKRELGQTPEARDLKVLAENARRQGKEAFALQAEKMLEEPPAGASPDQGQADLNNG